MFVQNVHAIKPTKYGIEVWSMVDSNNSNLLMAYIYGVKYTGGPQRQQAKRVVHDLTTTILNSGRIATRDTFFTYVYIADELLRKVAMLGSPRKNQADVKYRHLLSISAFLDKANKITKTCRSMQESICEWIDGRTDGASTTRQEEKTVYGVPMKPW